MKPQSVVMVVVDIHVETKRAIPAKKFHARATVLQDEMMKLDECNADLLDPTVSSDADRHVINVEMLIATDDQLEALDKAMTILRTALHAVGVNTGSWPIRRVENHAERVADLAAA